MPDIIKLLPDSVANQIAAGEVIQRPASVVKELTENAVDSGATEITILIKDAGRTVIQVTDNGSGMSETDARLCFERHATSKITSADDLFAIHTKGFRGEALASIAAISMVELKSRKRGDETGTFISISGSKVEKQEQVACQEGTSVSVKNLFYNVPARRKFLKTENTELRHIINEFERVAIAHSSIRFILINNDREIFNLPVTNQRQRIIGLFGKNINQALVNIETTTSLITITGFIGKPEFARKTFGEQYFFVNNRFMKHPYFHKAVMEAFENVLPADAIPSYFIFLQADPASIDVNIHPTKTEIKFENEREIWQIIHAAVREAIGKFNISPPMDFNNEGIIDIPVADNRFRNAPEIDIDPGFNPFSNESYQRPNLSFDRPPASLPRNWETLYSGISSDDREEAQSGISFGSGGEESDNKEASETLMQIKQRYIICPVKSGLMLIDQKRAHERILYEKFLAALENNSASTQKSLFPITVELNKGDVALLSDLEEELRFTGLEISYLGNNTISVTGYPSDAMNDNPAEVIEIFIEEYKSTGNDPGLSSREKLARSMSRAAAIPYGKTLSIREMDNLFNTLFTCSSPNWSPTGKPVVNIITLEELDKRINR
ncbi:MAG: DNA mismatch repair endonuclease MutL [Bacteroidales bacterium]|nr:DNA mismatch repair endonuclease MutL [Bacteroidales bacterium]